MNKTAEYQRRINAATNHVARNLDKSHSIEELAAIANFSKFHFSRMFRAVSGETVSNMVSRLRLEAAAATLVYNKDVPVTRVAVDHGYSSGANFTKTFTQHFGCSPTAYRSNSKIGKAKLSAPVDDGHIDHEVTLGHQPDLLLAYCRGKGPYLHKEISSMHHKVQQWANARECVASEPKSVGITWSDSHITDQENWIYDACVSVKPGTKGAEEISIQSLEAGTVAQLDVALQPGDNHDLSPHWDWFMREWFLHSDHDLRPNPSYELYLDAAEGFTVRLCLPITTNARRL